MVVDLAVVDEPDARMSVEPHGLHALNVVHNGQAVEAEAAGLEVVDVLDPKGIRPAVADGVNGVALHRHVVVAAEHCPDSAHLDGTGWRPLEVIGLFLVVVFSVLNEERLVGF